MLLYLCYKIKHHIESVGYFFYKMHMISTRRHCQGIFFSFLIMLYWLCYYSFPNPNPFLSSTQHPPLLQTIPHHFSCPWVMCISSLAAPFPVLYFTFPWLFCKHLFVLLNPLTSSPIPPHPISIDNHQNALCIHDSVSVLLVCLVCFRLNCC